MEHPQEISRRGLLRSALGVAAVVPMALKAASPAIPVGLELYSVRAALAKDLPGTLAGVAKMGYQCVEFYAPYYEWTPAQAREVRKQLDGLGVRCYSTHNGLASFRPAGIAKAIELNNILGTRYVVMAHPGSVDGLDGWKRVAELLNTANAEFARHELHAGYHNHDLEWKPVEGRKPLELLAAGTEKSVILQLDVGTVLSTGNDPVAWIKANPGRIRSMHCKDWSQADGFHALFGEGDARWADIFRAAETVGGVEYYLIEQEGSKYPEMETAERCLANWRKARG